MCGNFGSRISGMSHRGFLLSPRTTTPSCLVYLFLSFVPVVSTLGCAVQPLICWPVFLPSPNSNFGAYSENCPCSDLRRMANKLKHMEPTDESDGFVNITPDPNGPAQVGEHFCVLSSRRRYSSTPHSVIRMGIHVRNRTCLLLLHVAQPLDRKPLLLV
jgi:hypothetical protein